MRENFTPNRSHVFQWHVLERIDSVYKTALNSNLNNFIIIFYNIQSIMTDTDINEYFKSIDESFGFGESEAANTQNE